MVESVFRDFSYPQQEKLTQLTEISIRSLSAVATLCIRNQQLYTHTEHIAWFAPHLASSWSAYTQDHLRALADATALRFLYSDRPQFLRNAPQSQQELWVTDILEQYRVESLVPVQYQGMQQNINRLFNLWSYTVFSSDYMESDVGIFFFAFLLICRSRLSGIAIDARYQEIIEPARMALAPALGTPLLQMHRALHSQTAFAPPARKAAALIVAYITTQSQTKNRTKSQRKTVKSTAALFLQDYKKTNQPMNVVSYDPQAERTVAQRSYTIFTTSFDREISAQYLVREALAADYRLALTNAIAHSGIHMRVIEYWLARLLQQPCYDGWQFDQYNGRIDGKKLAGLISTPSDMRIFKRERIIPITRCTLSMLIDNSGSMKQHRQAIAIIVDVLALACSRLGIDCEILGFTTSTWGGGQAKKLWKQQGEQPFPGRVCDCEHIIYKDFTTPWRKAKQSIATLMHESLYKEGVDGEAVAWASERLIAHTHAISSQNTRAILLVFSDGSPMETTSTQLNNDDEYLSHHLATTVRHYQQAHRIDICGVGVGLSLRPFYASHCALSLENDTITSSIKAVIDMLHK